MRNSFILLHLIQTLTHMQHVLYPANPGVASVRKAKYFPEVLISIYSWWSYLSYMYICPTLKFVASRPLPLPLPLAPPLPGPLWCPPLPLGIPGLWGLWAISSGGLYNPLPNPGLGWPTGDSTLIAWVGFTCFFSVEWVFLPVPTLWFPGGFEDGRSPLPLL